MDSRTESSNSSLSSWTSSQGKNKRRKSNTTVSTEHNTDNQVRGITSLSYWSNYYKAIIWQNTYQVQRWRMYALSLEYERRYLLQEVHRLKKMVHYPSNALNAFTQNRARLGESSESESEEGEGNEDENENDEDEDEDENEEDEDEDENDEDENENEEDENEEDEDENENEEDEDENDDEDEEIEFEVTDEMMEFVEQSVRRKLEKNQLKEKEAEQLEQNVKDLKEAHEMREKEMKLLYGEGSCMITGMETAVQLSFDKYCDLKSPVYWPNIPLNLQFS